MEKICLHCRKDQAGLFWVEIFLIGLRTLFLAIIIISSIDYAEAEDVQAKRYAYSIQELVQARRYASFQELIKEGIFVKVEMPASLPQVWVKPRFYALNFEQKQNLISLVWTYYNVKDSAIKTVVVYDSTTGKEVGTFNKAYGLEMK